MTDGPLSESKGRYQQYVQEVTQDIHRIVQAFGCQPILFVGTGLAKRYFGAPSWDELLADLARKCELIDKGLGFYKQSLETPMKVGEEFAKKYQEWAWTSGHNEFPDELFRDNVPALSYIKFKIAEYLSSITPTEIKDLNMKKHKREISTLQQIKPHAIITTNYDTMIELLFPDLEPIIGQQILKGQHFAVGEIFKIHGCVREFDSLVFSQSDYEHFMRKKKFLSAKLLTFFNEHPLVFIGYSATDPNIRGVLADIDEALPEKGGVIPNVYILEWNRSLTKDSNPPKDKVIPTEEGRSIRVKLIEADDFTWVFEAFAANPVLNNINPRVLRALIARSYHLVRHDIPKSKLEADFELLSQSVQDAPAFAKLFGLAEISEYSAASARYKYSLTELGKALGGPSWHLANKLIDKVKAQTGINIKASDNVYHRTEKLNKSRFHKYSDEALLLLKQAKDDTPFQINMN